MRKGKRQSRARRVGGELACQSDTGYVCVHLWSFVSFVSMYLGNKLLGVGSLGRRASGCSLQFRMHSSCLCLQAHYHSMLAQFVIFFKTSLEDKQGYLRIVLT